MSNTSTDKSVNVSTGKQFNTVKELTFAAMAIALATITSYIKVLEMPMGGSVTLLSMLFICLIGYWYGPKAGILTGITYGLLQFALDPYVLSIPQVVIDYPLAFGALGLSGFFRSRKHGLIIGYLVGVFGRYLFAILSGVVFFASYAPEGMNPFVYSVLYNGSYLGAEALITVLIIAMPPVSKALARVKTF